MSYLSFNKEELVNLEYSLSREILSTNRAGSYMNTTIVCCNTRKYHGLLVCPLEAFGQQMHVLLSSLDESIIQHDQAFNFGIRRYQGGVYEPRGHKYIVDFKFDPTPTIEYRVGGVHLRKELLMVHNEDQIMIRYTLLDAKSHTVLRLKPYLAFRNIHALTRANHEANVHLGQIDHGVSSCLYQGFPTLHMQTSKKAEFVVVPDWYENIEYKEEESRGYACREDQLVPGFFELPLKKGESVVFSASLKQVAAKGLLQRFDDDLGKRSEKNTFNSCLRNAANQFLVKRGGVTELVAGYPWLTPRSRDTFIALPGATLYAGEPGKDNKEGIKLCKEVLDCMVPVLKGGLFPNLGCGDTQSYTQVDAPFWYIWAVQQYDWYTGKRAEVWKSYGSSMKQILAAFRQGVDIASMHENGLIWAAKDGCPLTWMNAVVDGRPVTPREGYQVEVNALWYNAVCYVLELATQYNDKEFVEDWQDMPAKIGESFKEMFWISQPEYLADYVDADGRQNTDVRPNQLFAASLKYSPLSDRRRMCVLDTVAKNLLVNKGIRTLSPDNAAYEGHYCGHQQERDKAYHQGSAWPWLLGHYVEAQLSLQGKAFVSKAKWILENFHEDVQDHGISSLPELYDGDPSHQQAGCISFACTVAEILRATQLIKDEELKK